MKRKLVALMALGLMTGALMVPTAAQAQFAGGLVVDCTLVFPSPSNSTSCHGPASTIPGVGGIGVGVNPLTPCVNCDVDVVAAYSEPCPVAAGFPVLGTATGTISAAGATGNFDWVRVGVTAVIVPLTGDSVGVGLLLPHPPLGDCGAPNDNQLITIVAAGASGLPI